MNRRRTTSGGPGALRPHAPPSLESRLDELQEQLDHLAREAREMRRLIDARKATAAAPARRGPDGSRDRES